MANLPVVPEIGAFLDRPATYAEILYAHLALVETAIEEADDVLLHVAAEFRTTLPKRRLVLYVKRVTGSKRPRALYWGRVIKGWGEVIKGQRRCHLKGGLKSSHVFWIARDHAHRSVYYEFDRRAADANAARSLLAKTSLHLLLSAERRRYGTPLDVPPLDLLGVPSVLFHRLDPSRLGGVWTLSCRLADSVRRQVALAAAGPDGGQGVLALSFDRDLDHPFGRLRWRGGDGLSHRKLLTWRELEAARLSRERARAVMAAELERRRLTREGERLVDAFRSYVRRAATAVAKARTLMAHAREPVLLDGGQRELFGTPSQ